MPVVWRLRVHGPGRNNVVLAGATSYEAAASQMDDFATRFLRSRSPRLIVAGGSGAGKTTFAFQLTLALLRTGTDQAPDRVPIWIPASSWILRDPRHEKFTDWMADQLVQICPVLGRAGTDLPERLVGGGQVVPVLDGLDELDEAQRAQLRC